MGNLIGTTANGMIRSRTRRESPSVSYRAQGSADRPQPRETSSPRTSPVDFDESGRERRDSGKLIGTTASGQFLATRMIVDGSAYDHQERTSSPQTPTWHRLLHEQHWRHGRRGNFAGTDETGAIDRQWPQRNRCGKRLGNGGIAPGQSNVIAKWRRGRFPDNLSNGVLPGCSTSASAAIESSITDPELIVEAPTLAV